MRVPLISVPDGLYRRMTVIVKSVSRSKAAGESVRAVNPTYSVSVTIQKAAGESVSGGMRKPPHEL